MASLTDGIPRCSWVTDDPEYISYHDTEWGVPCYDERKLFEMLVLEGAQAGLSWLTVLKKRDNYREAFDNFDAEKLAQYTSEHIEERMQNKGIIRNKRKIAAAVTNARAYLAVKQEYGSLCEYLWQFVGGRPQVNFWRTAAEVPINSKESLVMSKELRKRGFSFVGPTICYSFMQAVGMVNDHTVDCFRRS